MQFILFFIIGSGWRLKRSKLALISVWEFGENGYGELKQNL